MANALADLNPDRMYARLLDGSVIEDPRSKDPSDTSLSMANCLSFWKCRTTECFSSSHDKCPCGRVTIESESIDAFTDRMVRELRVRSDSMAITMTIRGAARAAAKISCRQLGGAIDEIEAQEILRSAVASMVRTLGIKS